MGQFLTFNEIDTSIQNKMANQSPSQSVRLEAINETIQDAYSDYDIDTGKRSAFLYVVPDGNPIDISAVISDNDLKHISDVRFLATSKQTEEFAFIDDDLFTVHIGQGKKINEYALPYNNGKQYLRLNAKSGAQSIQVHDMASVSGTNGTWSADTTDSDAANLTTTEVVTLNQSEALEFDIDVSQSANNYALISNSALTAIDLSDYVNLGQAKFWVYLPTASFTSITLRWGSSDSAYWEASATAQADGSAFQVGWNFIQIDWEDATQTGTVDNENIDYAALKLSYASGLTDQSNVRVEAITFYLPIPVKVTYFTTFGSRNSSGTFQEDLTTANSGSDEVLLPRRFKTFIVASCLVKLFPIAVSDDAEVQVRRWERVRDREIIRLGLDIGNKPKTAGKKMKIRPMW